MDVSSLSYCIWDKNICLLCGGVRFIEVYVRGGPTVSSVTLFALLRFEKPRLNIS